MESSAACYYDARLLPNRVLSMDVPAIEAVLREKIPQCELELVAEGNKLSVKIVSDEFAGLSRVKRQQKIYVLLDDRIKSGEIHAVSMITQTLEEAG